ncbi:MAG TPA: ATP-binding cassette domain-containing protein, partial [Chloroflexi bacterium]|nr:ATP-binding cassette domain-containing protein [Chloroflexota bacterium]
MSTPLVELKDVSKVFRLGGLFRRVGLHVISNVSLTIESGEIVCLVGESGCGKTTLGRIVLGLVEPTSGEV